MPPSVAASSSRNRQPFSEPPQQPEAGPSGTSSSGASRPSPGQRRRIDPSASSSVEPLVPIVASGSGVRVEQRDDREVIVLSSGDEDEVVLERDTGPRRRRFGVGLEGEVQAHLRALPQPRRRNQFSPAQAPPRRSHSPVFPDDIAIARPRPPPPARRRPNANPAGRDTLTIQVSDSDSDLEIVGAIAARPGRYRAPPYVFMNEAEDISDDDDDLDAEAELAFLERHGHFLPARQPPLPHGGNNNPLRAFQEFVFGPGGAGAGGGVGGLPMQRPIGLEQQWRDAGAFAPPEPLPTRRLFSRNCELEVQGVEDSSSEEEEEVGEEEEVERSLISPVKKKKAGSEGEHGEGESGDLVRKLREKKTAKKTKRRKKAPAIQGSSASGSGGGGAGGGGLTFGCSSCARPLLLSAATASRRIWSLSCGHLIDGWCLSHLEFPPPGLPLPPIPLDTVPTKKGKGRAAARPAKKAKTSKADNEWTWVCPVEGCEREHISDFVWVDGKDGGEGAPKWVARKGEEGVVGVYI